ncbi:MAG: hypothetical protein JSV44_02895, partial [Candidatus Zixiibacteriota bacterium]
MVKRFLHMGWFCLLFWFALITPALADECYNCHAEWEEDPDSPSQLYALDIHFKAGLGCSDCHGGNPEFDDMDEVRADRTYTGIPKPEDIPQFCSSCHGNPSYMKRFNPALPTDQLDKYRTSV